MLFLRSFFRCVFRCIFVFSGQNVFDVHLDIRHGVHALYALLSRRHRLGHLWGVAPVDHAVCGALHHFDLVQVLRRLFVRGMARLSDADLAPLVQKPRDGTKPGDEQNDDDEDFSRMDVERSDVIVVTSCR